VERCYFCLEALHQPGKPISRHHRLPKRLLNSVEKRDMSNIKKAHEDCHVLYHKIIDRPKLSRQQYIRYMQSINYAYGIFAQPEAMAAD